MQTRTSFLLFSSGVPRVGLQASRAMVGAPSTPRVGATGKANANPAISTGASSWTAAKTFKPKGQSFIDCSPRTRDQGGAARPGVRPVTLAHNTRAGPKENVI